MLTARLCGSQATRPLLVLLLLQPLLLHVSKAADTISGSSGETDDGVNKRSNSLRHIELLSRRSALDKNFMRFGRSGASNFMRLGRANGDNFMRFGRGGGGNGGENFMRFGKGGHGDNFMRFGRGDSSFMRFGRRNNDDNTSKYMRLGRADRDMAKYMRFGRGDDYEDFQRYARRNDQGSNFMRFGRDRDDGVSNFMRFSRPAGGGNNDDGTNFMRFGRGPDNFMRFGRDSGKNGEIEESADNHPLMPNPPEQDDATRERRAASWSDDLSESEPHSESSVIWRQRRVSSAPPPH